MALRHERLARSALRLLERLAGGEGLFGDSTPDAAALLSADLACRDATHTLRITEAGRAHLARLTFARRNDAIDPFRGQHLSVSQRPAADTKDRSTVTFDESESPLMWLARRKGRDGKTFIQPHQLQAGERLRADFTLGQLMPRTTSNWESAIGQNRSGDVGLQMADRVIAARQRLRMALDAAGPELSGLLVDVCCFLKKLEDVECEREWPVRSAKVVLRVALDRLARHYGYGEETRGPRHAGLRQWTAPDVPAADAK